MALPRFEMAHRPYVGRLAPSPTGDIHDGIARTSLAAWLDARAHDGRLLLRIEDLDTPRVVHGATEGLQRDLEWLGLTWDGPVVRQSDRHELYSEALTALSDRTYPCTCSRREIRAASAPHPTEEHEPRYPGTCRAGVSTLERTPSTRLRLEPEDRAELHDRARGRSMERVQDLVGDFVVRRADGLWAYQLAVSVDDLTQGITSVVRGDDLWSSTGRQVFLRSLLAPALATEAVRPLSFFHVPLMMDDTGRKLSKRHGARTVASRRAAGEDPRRVIGELAHSLGLTPEPSPREPHELIEAWRDRSRLPGPITSAPSE
jgi:glutamyl-queuosine tRNA(Asp) synthetase